MTCPTARSCTACRPARRKQKRLEPPSREEREEIWNSLQYLPSRSLVLLGLNEPMVVTLSEAKSLGTMGGMLRSAQHDKPLGYFRRDVLAGWPEDQPTAQQT